MKKANKIIAIFLTAAVLMVCFACPTYALSGYDDWKHVSYPAAHYFHIFTDCGVLSRGVANCSGYLIIDGDFNKYDDGESSVRLTIEIRDADTHEV